MGTDWTVTIDDKTFTAQQISAFILQKLKRDAESYLGEMITDAVISVPACFSDAQRKATIAAGQIAGLDVLCMINEPTAVALGHPTNEATILVFDLGGGNLSISVIGIGEDGIQVKATGGDTRLGGDDWDQRIVDWLVRDFKTGHGMDLSQDTVAPRRSGSRRRRPRSSCLIPPRRAYTCLPSSAPGRAQHLTPRSAGPNSSR